MSKTYKIALVPGDGIGHEITPAGVKVLEKAASCYGFALSFDEYGYGAGYYKKHGVFMPSDGLSKLKKYDAILFGAVGLPDVDDTLPAKDYTFKVRTNFQQYVNLRPVRNWKGVTRPLRSEKAFDFVVVRENTEGEFVQVGSQVQPDTEHGMG
ncbi:MAG: isocitrate/isopropylmalate family dehydrogenase, partial [Bacteroidales bacterium]